MAIDSIGPRFYLNELIFKKKFHITNFLPPNKIIYEVEWLDQISEVIPENKNYYIIAMFNPRQLPAETAADKRDIRSARLPHYQ